MKPWLRRISLALLIGLLVLGPVVAGKLWVWQGLLVGLVAGLALLLWALAALLPGQKPGAAESARGAPDLLDWALIVFLLWQTISWAVSVYRFATEIYLVKLFAGAIVFWVLRYGLQWRGDGEAEPRRAWRLALWALVAGGVLLSVIGLREYVRTVFFLGQADWRVFGTMVNPNAAAGYLLITLFPALALLLGSQSRAARTAGADTPRSHPPVRAVTDRDRRPKKRPQKTEPEPDAPPQTRYPEIAALFAFGLMFATLLLTGSKAGLAAMLAGIVLFAIVGLSGKPRAQWTVIGLALLTVIVAFALPPIRVRLLSAFGAQSHSTVFRLYTWQATWQMIWARPWLGFGGGTFENIFPRFAIAGFTRAAHQSFLQIAAETGVPGLLLALGWGTMVLRRLVQIARAAHPLARLTAAAALAALTASALQELFDYPWYVPAVSYSFFALAGLALACSPRNAWTISSRAGGPPARAGEPPALLTENGHVRDTARAPQQTKADPVSRPVSRRGWMAAAAAGLLLTVWCGKNLIAEAMGARGDMEVAAGAHVTASATYEQAARWNPAQARFPVQQSKVEEALAAGGMANAVPRAVRARLRAIALQPTEPINYLALARLYERAGELDSALRAARTALENYPNYPRGLAQLAQLQERAGQHQEALATYRRLLDLERSPVGLYPPVESVKETSFAWGWMALGDEALAAGKRGEALVSYSRAALIIESSIAEQMMVREMVGGEDLGFGHLDEDTQMAEEVLGRLGRIDRPLALMRQAQLNLSLRRTEEGMRLLETLVSAESPGQSVADALAVQWGRLRLARELPEEDAARAQALTRQALGGGVPTASPEMLSGQGWLPEDAASLEQLRQWAERR